MKVCINCHTENSDDAICCSRCGMSLIGASAGEEAMKLKELAAKPEADSGPQPKQPGSMFKIWLRAVTRPVLATYEELLQGEPNPTQSKAVHWMANAGLIGGALSGLVNLLLGMAQGESGGTLLVFWVTSLVAGPVVAVLGFAINSVILLAIARALGGKGNLSSQSYLLAAALAPMSIISGCLATIPSVGVVISWITGMYLIYLEVLALRAAHRFGWGKAVGAPVPTIVFYAVWAASVFSSRGR